MRAARNEGYVGSCFRQRRAESRPPRRCRYCDPHAFLASLAPNILRSPLSLPIMCRARNRCLVPRRTIAFPFTRLTSALRFHCRGWRFFSQKLFYEPGGLRDGNVGGSPSHCRRAVAVSVEKMPDQRLVHYYENIRQQVGADRAHKHQFATGADGVGEYADRLRSEMIRRRLGHAPIDWPSSIPRDGQVGKVHGLGLTGRLSLRRYRRTLSCRRRTCPCRRHREQRRRRPIASTAWVIGRSDARRRPGAISNFGFGARNGPGPRSGICWTVIVPRRSITGRLLIAAMVWRRHDGRRWIYKKFVEYRD